MSVQGANVVPSVKLTVGAWIVAFNPVRVICALVLRNGKALELRNARLKLVFSRVVVTLVRPMVVWLIIVMVPLSELNMVLVKFVLLVVDDIHVPFE